MAYIEFVDYTRPDLSQEEREQAIEAQKKLTSKSKTKHKKTLRLIQGASRKRNR
jgi:hypothetical protein